ncbi:putative dNA ligase [Mycobacterium xenopi 4042]|uniref:Putative dNA ligase n=1 Tax=Mycobacterium xenopi 4042 TaxID=1299334 RepID=X7Z5H7_MYCXE|nr:putative dNA ligase [Mycobacterium xenopi 4042]EUA33837.1 putative dNA ligase [Mycobacterium xenopi 3993]
MLLIDVATTSLDVAGVTARRTKVARIAELLHRAAPIPGWSRSSSPGSPASCRNAKSASGGPPCAHCRRPLRSQP